MGKKYYAVKQGRQTGIFENWSLCEKQVRGFSGAAYKSFTNIEEAKKFLNDGVDNGTEKNDSITVYPCAYVDGSFDSKTKRFSYGAVIMENADSEYSFSKRFDNSLDASMRNVAGEIQGSAFAIQYALDHNWPEIYVYYDYYGIEKWATGEWKRNLTATKEYYRFCQKAFEKINVHFVKVKGHSGNKYNDKADALAREALNL